MNKLIRLAALTLIFAASGCSTYSLQNLRETTPRGTPYQSTIALKYLEHADTLEKNYAWENSWHFADKGLLAAYGHDVEPEKPEDWDIKNEDLTAARQQLEAALTDDAKTMHPKQAAEAVFFYDCWVEYQAAGWQKDKITYCRDNFTERLDALHTAEDAAPLKPLNDNTPADEGGTAPPLEKNSFLIFFGWAHAALDIGAERTIARIMEELKAIPSEYSIMLNGHTDTSGAEKFNMQLSLKRAQNVKAALVARGISPKRISVFGFGETDPLKATGDGVKEPQNRRVEIFIN